MSLIHRIKPIAAKPTEPSKPVRGNLQQTAEMKPEAASSSLIRKGTGGRPKVDDPKTAFTLRLPLSMLEQWQRYPDWRARMAEVLLKHAPE